MGLKRYDPGRMRLIKTLCADSWATDREIAERLGIPESIVATYRKKAGIPCQSERVRRELEPCQGCIYFAGGGFMRYCVYLDKVGHRRPCLPGRDCTEKTTDSERNRRNKQIADGFAAGLSDQEMAKKLGVQVGAVKYARIQMRLLRPHTGGRART